MARKFDEEAAITALIGNDQRLVALYHEDAEFHNVVVFSVRMMALTIDALADEAEKARALRPIMLDGLIRDRAARRETDFPIP